ncbi:MAG: histidine--tRNA ligase [Ignavibacteriales bacterium]|nr:histidine--tRNA ligase [Ignavibacteriales bacterium]
MRFKSIKGTKDILPEESYRWQFVEQTIRTVMHTFNYREIRTPIFEETALFARGIGELTDIVGKEMYTFQDRGGSSLTLKPEMTAAVMRSYLQYNLGEQQPLVKVYYIAPMFRQERPQAGRLRQFHQFGAEAIGGKQPAVDAEIIALSAEVYRTLGVRNFDVKINSVGCENCRPAYKEKLQKHLKNIVGKLSEESQKRFEQNPLRILDSKNENDQVLTQDAPLMKDHLCQECSSHFAELQKVLASLEIKFSVDGRIVRGLDYYTKTAYEIISKDLGSQDALVGGGRYDLLLKELGGKQTPSVGFAAGIERLLVAMEKNKAYCGNEHNPTVFIASADETGRSWSLAKAMEFRRRGISCDVDTLNRSLKSQMREADRQRVKYVIIIGQNELSSEQVSVKDMTTGEQTTIMIDELITYIERGVGKHEQRKTGQN